jgi:hypothetical protein
MKELLLKHKKKIALLLIGGALVGVGKLLGVEIPVELIWEGDLSEICEALE